MKTSKMLVIFILLWPVLLSACGNGSSGFLRPNGVIEAADGSLYVMDLDHYRVVHTNAAGKFLNAIGTFGDRKEQIYYGWDIALDPKGNIYICNKVTNNDVTLHDGVKEFSTRGKLVREVGAADYAKDSGVQPNEPYALEVDQQGRVYISDYGTSTIRVFDPNGKLITSLFKNDGEYVFQGLGDVAIDESRSLMYVVDYYASLVVQFQMDWGTDGSLSLTQLQMIGKYGRGEGDFAFPQGIAVDQKTGDWYVGDQGNRRIAVYDAQGNFLRTFAPVVTDWHVLGLAVGKEGTVFATDALNNVVWAFSPKGEVLARIEGKP